MSYFNSEQTEYMEYLAKVPLNTKCWCGWYKLGECSNCPPDKTCQDKMDMACKECGSTPSDWKSPIVYHYRYCSLRKDKCSDTK